MKLGRCALGVLACSLLVAARGEASSKSSLQPTTTRAGALLQEVRATFGAHAGVLRTAAPIARPKIAEGAIAPMAKAPKKATQSVDVRLPLDATGPTTLTSHGMTVEVRAKGLAASTVAWAQKIAIYADVAEGMHLFKRAAYDGVEDFYRVDHAKDSIAFAYEIALANAAGLRMVGGSIELLDAAGTPRLVMPAPILHDAKGVARTANVSIDGCAYDVDARGPWGRPVVSPGKDRCTIHVRFDARGLASPILVDPAWRGTADMFQARASHRLVVLAAGPDAGKVLALGGTGSGPQSTELFDPKSATWAASSDLCDPIAFGAGTSAVALADGTVLIAGGLANDDSSSNATGKTCRRAIDGTWAATGTVSARAYATMNLVSIGGVQKVLLAGGQSKDSLSTSGPLKSAEIFDPVAGTWSLTGAMTTGHTEAASALLPDGRVVVAGSSLDYDTSAAVDIYDPTKGTWSAGAKMAQVREEAVAVSVKGGVLVVGGYDNSGLDPATLDSVEFFDGTAWTTLSAHLATSRAKFAGAVLDDGRVLFGGGDTFDLDTYDTILLDSTELFDPGADATKGTFTTSAPLPGGAIHYLAAVNVPKVGALFTGGNDDPYANDGSETSTSAIFDVTIGAKCSATTDCASGLTCTEGVCCTTASCDAGETCAAPGHEGVCAKPIGTTCGAGSECATGFCVEGVCCDTACDGTCQSCGVAGKVGTCTQAATGTDPGGQCMAASDGGDPTCGPFCDDTGSCDGYADAGTSCGPGKTSFCAAHSCDGAGTCALATNDCGLGACTTNTTCSDSTQTCSASASDIRTGYCLIDGACHVYGDVDPKDACHLCDSTQSNTQWSSTGAPGCPPVGSDAGAPTDSGTGSIDDAGASADTGAADQNDAGSTTGGDAASGGAENDGGSGGNADLPEASTCDVAHGAGAGGASGAFGIVFAALAVAFARRRR